MHKLTTAAGGLRGIIPQGLAVPSQVEERRCGSTSVGASHRVAFCSDTEGPLLCTWVWRAVHATSSIPPVHPGS